MAELLHAGALLPAAVGACCTLGSVRSRRLAAALSAIVMLLAMLDATVGVLRVPTFVWTAVLVAAALAAALAGRLATGAPHPGGARAVADPSARTRGPGRRSAPDAGARVPVPARHAGAMAAHGSAGLLVTAGLLAAMGGAGGASAVGASWGAGLAGSMHHAGSASGALLTMSGVGALVYMGLSAVLALRLPRATLRDRMAVAEVASMAASTALMLAALLIP